MQLCIRLLSTITLGTGLTLAATAIAADLPQSGRFNIHSAWKLNDQVAQIGDKHFMGSGNAWGITYNDAGNGPLHMGSTLCANTFDIMNDFIVIGGRCAWGDTDGDKIFTEWSAKGTTRAGIEGLNTITGGTGKFDGIKGKAPVQCKGINPEQGQLTCNQQFEYSLAGEPARK